LGADGDSGRRIFRTDGGFAAAAVIRGSDVGFGAFATGIRALDAGRGTPDGSGRGGFGMEAMRAFAVGGRASSNIVGGIELGTTCTSASMPSGTFIPLSGLGSLIDDKLESALLSSVDMGLINDNGRPSSLQRLLRARAHFDATTSSIPRASRVRSQLFSPCSPSVG
jgi:hypothetical protein